MKATTDYDEEGRKRVLADFTPTGGVHDVVGIYSDKIVEWSDGTVWHAKVPEGPEPDLSGDYMDPVHMKCRRYIVDTMNGQASVSGTVASSGFGMCDGETDTKWGPIPATTVHMKSGKTLRVVFDGDELPSKGTFNIYRHEIEWIGGNYWPRVNLEDTEFQHPDTLKIQDEFNRKRKREAIADLEYRTGIKLKNPDDDEEWATVYFRPPGLDLDEF